MHIYHFVSGHLIKQLNLSCYHLFRLETEVWNYENQEDIKNNTIKPVLLAGDYRYGVGVFAVDRNFCKITNSTTEIP